MSEKKTAILNLIKENKNILFGKFSETLTHEDKAKKWQEIAAEAAAQGILDGNKNWKYCRDVIWQNWKKRSVERAFNRNRRGPVTGRKRKLAESDNLILEIIRRDSPVEELPVYEISGEYFKELDSPEIITPDAWAGESVKNSEEEVESDKDELEKEIQIKLETIKREEDSPDFEGLLGCELSEKDFSEVIQPGASALSADAGPATKRMGKKSKFDKEELEKEIVKMKLQLLKRDLYLKDLEIYKKERELGLSKSQFTRKFWMLRR